MKRHHYPSKSPTLPRVALAVVTALLVSGCALVPPAPPDCNGPWTPINPAAARSPS